MTRREFGQLLALLASFVVAGYAGIRLLAGNPVGVGAWFVGSAVGHDLLLFRCMPGWMPCWSCCCAATRRWPPWAVSDG